MKKILIAYSTWAGATHEVASEIGKIFKSEYFDVEVVEASTNKNLENFDAFLLGTSIHAGQTGKSFRSFIKKNIDVLNKKPTAIFVVCANMMVDSEDNRVETLTWIERAIGKYRNFKPFSIGLFGGATLTNGKDFDKLNFFIRKIISSMNKKMVEEFGKSDFRDWKSVQSWVRELIKQIKN